MKPSRPELPVVTRGDWARNPIDRFVLARLEREKLSPSPEAAQADAAAARHARPHRPAADAGELDAFLADTAPDAYEQASSTGCSRRRTTASAGRGPGSTSRATPTPTATRRTTAATIWKYRDWVIDALNRDMPFDQFTIEQIAGDMLPNATTEQKIATGFHRNAMTNEEGGVDPEESRYEVLVDRVNTTATVWLGTTLGCAQCHNHKYDPFSRRTTSGCSRSSPTPTTRAGRSATARATSSRARSRHARAGDARARQLQAEIDRLEQELKTPRRRVREAQDAVGAVAASRRALVDAARAGARQRDQRRRS